MRPLHELFSRVARKAGHRLGLARRSDLLTMYELHLLAGAAAFRLWEPGGRKASNRALVELYFGLLGILKPKLFLEVGAKKAEASVRARHQLPGARIVAFEASPENYQAFATSRGFAEQRIEYRHQAACDFTGTVPFNTRRSVGGEPVAANSGGNSILRRSADGVTYDIVDVPCTTLDGEFGGSRAFLWIDVEGASRQVLLGHRQQSPRRSVC